MAVVLDLDGSIDPAPEFDTLLTPIGSMDDESHRAHRLQCVVDSKEVVRLRAIKPEALCTDPIRELQRQNAHADEV